MKIGLFFGSFNPIHNGHLILAEGVLNHSDLDQVWFVVTPQNPAKKKDSLLADHHRLNMVRDVIYDNVRFKVSDVEFHLAPPHYTAVTLTHLKEKHPGFEFSIIMGEDNLRGLGSWFNHAYILKNYRLLIYPRNKQENELLSVKKTPEGNIEFLSEVPVLEISSSEIRGLIKKNKSIKYMVPESTERMIQEMRFYKR